MALLRTADPYRVRLAPIERGFIATLVVGSAIWFALAPFMIKPSTLPWQAVSLYFGAPTILFLVLRPFMRQHVRQTRQLATERHNLVCPRCHYPMKPESVTTALCTDCGFWGESRRVEEAWREYFAVRTECD